MHIKKGICAMVAVLVASTGFAGCGNMVSVNPQKDEAQVIAVIEDTEIPKSEYYDLIDTLGSAYGFSTSDMKDGDNAESLRTYVLDQLVNQEALYKQAEKDGLVDDSEEHRQEVREEIENTLKEQKDSYDEMYDDESQAEEAYNNYVEQNGYDDLDAAVEQKIKDDAINAEYEKITDPVEVTDEEAQEYYDEQVETQKAGIEEDPTNYSLYTQSGGNYYNPPGSDYVKNLLIALPDDVQSEISSLRSSGDTEAADQLRDEELAKIEIEAHEALARAQSGEDFDVLIEELGDDPGMTQEPAATYGYMVYEGSSFVPAFEEASLALTEDGEISGLVPTDYGYHIIMRVSDAEGPVPYDSVKDTIIEQQTSTKKSETYQEFLDSLKESMDITTYPERLEVYR